MKSLEDRIKDLENERNKEKQVEILQEIGKLLLTKYKIQIGDLWMYVFPREIAVMPMSAHRRSCCLCNSITAQQVKPHAYTYMLRQKQRKIVANPIKSIRV